jgi:hypothetical protein
MTETEGTVVAKFVVHLALMFCLRSLNFQCETQQTLPCFNDNSKSD